MKYPVSQPDLTGNEKKYVSQAIDEGWVSSQGKFIPEFEEKFAEKMGVKYAATCSSGTTALTLALRAMGIGDGGEWGEPDEVIVPNFTMIASAWAVTYTGATPVFVDCGNDLNIDCSLIEDAITPRTKAIMPVHIYGRPCNMKEVKRIAYEYNLQIIEDSCEALGSSKVGSETACYSFFGNKIMTTGEGGMVTSNDKRIIEQVKHLRAMAFDNGHTFLHKKIGYNFRMTNIQAAVGLAQLERLDEFLEKRQQIQDWYDEELKEFTIERPEGSVMWYYDMMTPVRDMILPKLKEDGIDTRVFFKPMTQQPMYLDEYKNTRAYKASLHGFYLPTYIQLTKKDIKYISERVKKYIYAV